MKYREVPERSIFSPITGSPFPAMRFSIVFVLFPISALTVQYHWIGTNGSWNDPSNWNPYGQPNAHWAQAPDVDSAYLDFSDSVVRVIDGVGPSMRIVIGNTGTGHVIWNISDGSNGSIVESSGIMTGMGLTVRSGTTLNMTGGWLGGDSPGALVFESGSTANQSGGLLTGAVNIYTKGVYNLSGAARIDSGNASIANTGVFNQTGGVIDVFSAHNHGTYNFIAGELDAIFANSGQLNIIGGGTRHIKQLNNNGIVNASGTVYIEEVVNYLDIVDGVVIDITGVSGTTIYYDPINRYNEYLGGLTYPLLGAGYLIPVPEPSAMPLVGSGLLGLAALRKRFTKITGACTTRR